MSLAVSPVVSPLIDRAAWLEARRSGIGASEAGAVLGLSRFGDGPMDVYVRKIGEDAGQDESEAMTWGRALEGAIIAEYTRRTGIAVLDQQRFIRSQTYPWLFATLDGIGQDGAIVEVKTVGPYSPLLDDLGDSGSDDIPDAWLAQAHVQMHCACASSAVFAVLIAGQDFRTYPIQRSDALLDAMLPKLRDFWGHVERREPPPYDGPLSPRLLAALNPECAGELELPADIAVAVEDYQQLSDQLKIVGEVRDKLRDMILTSLGTNQIGLLPDGRKVKRYLQHMPARVQNVSAHTRHYFTVQKAK